MFTPNAFKSISNMITFAFVLLVLLQLLFFSRCEERLLVVSIDNKFNFATHLANITRNAKSKFDATTRVQNYMTTEQEALIFLLLLSLDFLLLINMDVLHKTLY